LYVKALSYYEVHSLTDFYWSECPGNWNLYAQNLTIVGNLAIHQNSSEVRIYFVGHYVYGSDDLYYIHCLVDNGTAWNTVSPSYSADIYGDAKIADQLQSDHGGNIAVSHDGNTIIYFPIFPFNFICCFHNIDGLRYHYQVLESQIAESNEWTIPGSSLQFRSNNEFFLISQWGGGEVQHFIYNECYCINKLITNYD